VVAPLVALVRAGFVGGEAAEPASRAIAPPPPRAEATS
jgi:hypothetical protein